MKFNFRPSWPTTFKSARRLLILNCPCISVTRHFFNSYDSMPSLHTATYINSLIILITSFGPSYQLNHIGTCIRKRTFFIAKFRHQLLLSFNIFTFSCMYYVLSGTSLWNLLTKWLCLIENYWISYEVIGNIALIPRWTFNIDLL